MISIVIPAFDEGPSLGELHQEIVKVCDDNGLEREIVLVDDGSRDDTWDVIRGLVRADPNVRGVRLRRNFGKAAALAAGIEACSSDVVVTMDGDGQDDPSEIPRLLAALKDDLDLVVGWKRRRQDPFHKTIPSRVFNVLVNLSCGLKIHDHNCGLKIIRRKVFDEVRLFGELHRFIPMLAHGRGFHVAELEVNHRPRRFGRSKYGSSRFLKGFLDLILVRLLAGYGGRPQHILGALGVLISTIGLGGLSYATGLWIEAQYFGAPDYQSIATRPLTIYSVAALITGVQLLSLALLAGLMPYYVARDRHFYSVREMLGAPEEKSNLEVLHPEADQQSQ